MNDDLIQDELVHPDFDAINELQLFDSSFEIDFPFSHLDDMSVSSI